MASAQLGRAADPISDADAGTTLRPPILVHSPPFAIDDGPAWLQRGHIPSLDGLRAISIVLVLLAHMAHTQGFPLAAMQPHLARLGSLGVDVFFIISGFLITLLILRERHKSGTVSLRAFYVRRSFRILPAYLIFLTGVLVLCVLGCSRMRGLDWLGAPTYTVNFQSISDAPVSHVWSLSVEEHFYLLWPVLLAFWPTRAGLLAGGYVVLAPFVRALLHEFGGEAVNINYNTLTRIDTIALGCCLALLAYRPASRLAWLDPLTRRPGCTLAVVCVGLSATLLLSPRSLGHAMFLRTIFGLCFAALVWLAASLPRSKVGRYLNAPPAVWLGRLSYSVYLWQQPFLDAQGVWWGSRWPANLALVAFCAVASYYLVEAPLLRLRERRGWGATAPHNPAENTSPQALAVRSAA